MKHLTLPEDAHAIVVAPATANFLAKAAVGVADDVLTTMLLTARCPLVVAPAMDGGMWEHPTVVEHVGMLRARGVSVVDPEEGPLASGLVAQGRLAEESDTKGRATKVDRILVLGAPKARRLPREPKIDWSADGE